MAKKKEPNNDNGNEEISKESAEEVYMDESDYSIVPEAPLEAPPMERFIPEITIDLTPLISELKLLRKDFNELKEQLKSKEKEVLAPNELE